MPCFVPGPAVDLRLLLGGVRILLAFSGFIQFLRDRHLRLREQPGWDSPF